VNEWVWSIGGMVLTGENWSTGRKTLYSVGGRWMSGYGALVDWYWQGKTWVLGEKHYTASVVVEWMSMKHWCNDTDRGKPKYWEKIRSQCQFAHHKSDIDLPGTKPGPPRREAFSQPPEPWHGVSASPFTSSCCTYRAVEDGTGLFCGTLVRSWLRHCCTSRKFSGSIPDGVMEISGRTMALKLTHPLTEMSTRNLSWRTGGIRAAGAYDWQPYHLHVPIFLKSRHVDLLEPSWPVQGLLYVYLTSKMSKIILRMCWQHDGPLWRAWVWRTRFWTEVKKPPVICRPVIRWTFRRT